jgi:hypothetical protein
VDVARKARKIGLRERINSWKSNRRAREKRLAAIRNWNWVAIMKVAAVICFLTGSGMFLRYAEGYVRSEAPAPEGGLVLVGVPEWVNWDLKNRVAEVAGGTRFPLTEETASVLFRNLSLMSWLDDISVRVAHDSVLVSARWRKPVVMIEIRETASRIYVDQDLVVMDYMPMPHLPIVEATGVALNVVPPPGQVFDEGDLSTAVTLALLLNRMDIEYAPKIPLLTQIASIDVANYKGRKYPRGSQPHVTLRSKDDVQIVWGAEIGEYATYLEASDQEKIAKLYTHYKESGSLSGGGRVKYIHLLNPEDRVHQPIDKYR